MTVPHRKHLDRVLMAYDYLRIDGWLVAETDRLREVSIHFGGECVHVERDALGLPSPDIQLHPQCRFSVSCLVKDVASRGPGRICFHFEGGGQSELALGTGSSSGDSFTDSALLRNFLELLQTEGRRSLLDIGSRARSGVVQRDRFPGLEYLGIDVTPGPNVDVVMDAHELSAKLGRDRFDAVCSFVVFEHLAMPWKVAVEMNRVMRTAAIGYVLTTQTCGMHDLPWDFFRFSDSAFRALFNRGTGFEVLGTHLGTPMHVFPFVHHSPFWTGAEHAAGFFSAEVLVRKTADTTLDWPVPLGDIIERPYPA